MAARQIRELAKVIYTYALQGLSDKIVVGLDFARVFGRWPKLSAPSAFTDKMQHHKLFARDYRLPALADKITVKRHVSSILGRRWVTPTLWEGAEVSEAVLQRIPKPTVIKSNHASGRVAFVAEGSDLQKIAKRANNWLRFDYHLLHREWAYGKIARRLLIEPDISNGQPLPDYKFWMFDGEVKLVQVDKGRFSHHTRTFYDECWNKLELEMNYPRSTDDVPKPKHFDAMCDGARALAAGLSFVRVDLYHCDEHPRFGEMTFWPEAGLCRFKPPSYDLSLGASWTYAPSPAW